jgi:Ran GTPase-activating protein (RanGAP) involved in mRNA processing and transport
MGSLWPFGEKERNSTLQMIDLSSNYIGSEGAKLISEAIKENSVLQVIYLQNNEIGDEGVSKILRCRRLTCLTILLELKERH